MNTPRLADAQQPLGLINMEMMTSRKLTWWQGIQSQHRPIEGFQRPSSQMTERPLAAGISSVSHCGFRYLHLNKSLLMAASLFLRGVYKLQDSLRRTIEVAG